MTESGSVPSIRFFERLAPGARSAASTVSAALPSRFAPSPASAFAAEPSLPMPPLAAAAVTGPTTVAFAPHSEPAAVDVAYQPVPIPSRQAPLPLSRPAPARAAVAGDTMAPDSLPTRLRAAGVSASTATVSAARTQPILKSAASAHEANAPLPALAANVATPPAPRPAAAAVSIDARPPLRESTVAQRAMSTRSDAPTIVHVTIDRVDVRAPSMPAAPAREQKRRASSSVSLSDYLREHERTRRSGGST